MSNSTTPKQDPSQGNAADAATQRPRGRTRLPSRRPGRVGGKRDTNRKERTEAIHRAAMTLFLARGTEHVTVDEIARAAGTAKGNFYRYAADKRELVESLITPLATSFMQAFDRCDERMRTARSTAELTPAYLTLAMELFQVVSAHRDAMLLMLQESRAPAVGARAPIAEFYEQITARTVELTTLAHEHGLLGKIPPVVSALAVIGAVERIMIAYLRDSMFNDNPAAVVQSLVQLVMEGIG